MLASDAEVGSLFSLNARDISNASVSIASIPLALRCQTLIRARILPAADGSRSCWNLPRFVA